MHGGDCECCKNVSLDLSRKPGKIWANRRSTTKLWARCLNLTKDPRGRIRHMHQIPLPATLYRSIRTRCPDTARP